jgi:ketosteroid isomerase-like protein
MSNSRPFLGRLTGPAWSVTDNRKRGGKPLMSEFDEFMQSREVASTAFVDGDAGPLLAMSAVDDPASIFPPTGAVVHGAEAVNSGNQEGAETFAPGAENRFDVLHSGADRSLGYWTGVQYSRVRMNGKDEPVEMKLRVTELFRRVDGEWKLFHRHADLMREA